MRWLAAAGVAFLVMLGMTFASAGGPMEDTAVASGAFQPSAFARRDIPPGALRLYIAAGERYHLDWTILAAVGKIETDHCRMKAPGVTSGSNSAGAQGCMQFLASTWALPGVGNGGDPYTLEDSIPAAARYLIMGGAPEDYRKALFSYNHAQWYVDDVMALAAKYRGAATGGGGTLGSADADAIREAADKLDSMNIEYVYGGGHVQPARPNPGLDCSSSVSWVLQHAGIDVETMTSTGFMTWGSPGEGKDVTIYANPTHVWMTIGNRAFGTSGFGHASRGTGPFWFDRMPGASYKSEFVARHPRGL